ncbi:FAD-dependent oxidoreductase [Candidatus Gribaldobacteria bacterium]|nr:FAD-dependent oxidoreductase [Candidatus Gribaldobacteria bacterium]
MKNYYDVIIIGAGPAGLSCALELEKSDYSVLLLEKETQLGKKVCAGGLTKKVEAFFDDASVVEKKFQTISLDCGKVKKQIKLIKPFVATINRKKLLEIYLNKSSSKTEIGFNQEVALIKENLLVTSQGDKIKYKYLVGADGGNSVLRKSLGIKTEKIALALQYNLKKPSQDFELFFAPNFFGSGCAWIFPHSDYISIGCGTSQEKYKNNLKNNFEKWLKSKNINHQGLDLQGGIINFDYQGFDFGNKFLVGDAGGFASGLTGEGIYFALVSGKEIAHKIINPKYKCLGIKKILKIKKQHERVLRIINFFVKIHPSLALFFVKTLLPLIDNECLKNKIINKFS